MVENRGKISSLCALKMIFSIKYLIGGLKQVTLSQKQHLVINLECFLNFNMNNFARFRIFLPKWLITLKISLFYLARCYQSKMKMKNFYSKFQLSVSHVKCLGLASSVILLPFTFHNLGGIFPSSQALRKYFKILLPSFYSSWVKFTHIYAPNYQRRLPRAFLKSFLFLL